MSVPPPQTGISNPQPSLPYFSAARHSPPPGGACPRPLGCAFWNATAGHWTTTTGAPWAKGVQCYAPSLADFMPVYVAEAAAPAPVVRASLSPLAPCQYICP